MRVVEVLWTFFFMVTLGQKITQSQKGMVMYNKVHGTTNMSHHVASMHYATLDLYKTQCFNVTKHSNVHQKC